MTNCDSVSLSKYGILPRNPGRGYMISGALARLTASTNKLEELLSSALGAAETGRGLKL